MIPELRARYGSHYLDTASFYLQITSYFLQDFWDSVPSPAAAGHSTWRENSEITNYNSSSALNGRNEGDTSLKWPYIRSMTSQNFLSRDARMCACHLAVISWDAGYKRSPPPWKQHLFTTSLMVDKVSTIPLFYSGVLTLRVHWIQGKNIEFLAVIIWDTFQCSRTFMVLLSCYVK